MTNRKIEEVEKRLKDIQNKPFDEQLNLIYQLQKGIGLNLPHTLGNTTQKKIFNMTTGIRNFLQSKMMLNACVSAKRSCFWAAIAAIAACISIVVTFFGCTKPLVIEQKPNSAKLQPQIQTIDEEAINSPLAKLNKKGKELIKFLSTDYHVVDKTEKIQSNILNTLYEKLAGEKIANPDEEFNSSDVIFDDNIPQRRLVFAGNSSNSWFVCYEHGGIGLHCHLIIFSIEKEKIQIMFNGNHFYKPQNLKQLKQWVGVGKFDKSECW